MMMMINVNEAYALDLLASATNNGTRVEALTMLELGATQYAPYLDGSLGGDMITPQYGHVQVKYMNGEIKVPEGATGELFNDFAKALNADYSDTWVIWFSLKEYMVISKAELLKVVGNPNLTEQLIGYNTNRKKEKVVRLEMGTNKRKFFFGKVIKRTRAL